MQCGFYFSHNLIMVYNISERTFNEAKKLDVTVRPSTNKRKKIDVFKNGSKIASIGAIGMKDYPTHIRESGKEYADERRRLYKIRHSDNRTKKGTPGYFADRLLW